MEKFAKLIACNNCSQSGCREERELALSYDFFTPCRRRTTGGITIETLSFKKFLPENRSLILPAVLFRPPGKPRLTLSKGLTVVDCCGTMPGGEEFNMYKVLVVDDVAGLRQHMTAVLKDRVTKDVEITEAPNGAEGLKVFRTLKPDLIVMDIVMPEMSGIKAAQQIWAEQPRTKILFWSQFAREAYVRELGKIVPDEAIHGYALKSESDDKLVYALSSILLHDNPYIDPQVRGVQTRMQAKDGSLSDVEFETLLDIALGLTDKAIASRRHISVRGVQNRLSMLSQKLFKTEDQFLKETAGMEIFNPRTRIVLEGLKRGLIDIDEIPSLEEELEEWLEEEYDYQKA